MPAPKATFIDRAIGYFAPAAGLARLQARARFEALSGYKGASLTRDASLGWSIPLALGVSVAIGVFFGAYPAARAARMRPIQALRAE